MKTYEVFAKASYDLKLQIQADSAADAWNKAFEAHGDQFKEVPMTNHFKIYLVNEVKENNGSSTT